MVKNFFYLFIFFAPFTSFFALSAWLRLPVVLNIFLFGLTLIAAFKSNTLRTKWLEKEDLFLLGVLFLVWLSFVLGYRERRSFNHSLAYTNAILFYFILIKYIIKAFQISSIQIARIIYYSFLVCSAIIITDYIGKNYFDSSLRTVFSTADGITSNMDYYIRGGVFRVGGVAEEPGIMALFYNMYFGISLYYLHQKKLISKIKWLAFLFAVCHFALFSTAGIVLLVVAVIFIFGFEKLKRLTISKKQIFWLFLIFSTTLIASLIFLFSDISRSFPVVDDFINKVIFNEEAGSSSSARLHQWSRALSNFTNHPIFGNGPGFGVHQEKEGYLSVYLTILSDIGVVAFFFFICFQLSIFLKALRINSAVQKFVLFSLITTFLHPIIVADFYHAPFWILCAFIQLVYKENRATT